MKRLINFLKLPVILIIAFIVTIFFIQHIYFDASEIKDGFPWITVRWHSGNDIALFHVVTIGNSPEVMRLIKKGANVNAKEDNNYTPLHRAAQQNHAKVADILINHGAMVDPVTIDNYTPFHNAVRNGHLETAKVLLSHGAEIHTADKWGHTAMENTVRNGHSTMVAFLIEQGADINSTGLGGLTLLHSAVNSNRIKVTRLLLERGAATDIKDRQGYTPLAWAANRGYMEIAKLLLHYNADMKLTNMEGETPFFRAVMNKIVMWQYFLCKMVQMLMQRTGTEPCWFEELLVQAILTWSGCFLIMVLI